jgi:hypothetical protein
VSTFERRERCDKHHVKLLEVERDEEESATHSSRSLRIIASNSVESMSTFMMSMFYVL